MSRPIGDYILNILIPEVVPRLMPSRVASVFLRFLFRCLLLVNTVSSALIFVAWNEYYNRMITV
jgi:hypothetical protein